MGKQNTFNEATFYAMGKFNLGPLANGLSDNRACTDCDAWTELRGHLLVFEHKFLGAGREPPQDIKGRSPMVPVGQHVLFAHASERSKVVTVVMACSTNQPETVSHVGFYLEGKWTSWRRTIWPAVLMMVIRWDEWAKEHGDWVHVTVNDVAKKAADVRLCDVAQKLTQLDGPMPLMDLVLLQNQLRCQASGLRVLGEALAKLQTDLKDRESLREALLGSHDVGGRLTLTDEDVLELTRLKKRFDDKEAKKESREPKTFLTDEDLLRAQEWSRSR